MPHVTEDHPPPTGLILMGGGARAAYQVGVLDAISTILAEQGWPAGDNPFPIICGTSAGAINAVALAAGCDDHRQAIARIVDTWLNFRPDQVYRTDAIGAFGNAAHWLAALGLGWIIRSRPRSLFDNSPLAGLMAQMIDFARLPGLLDAGHLKALAVTASSYTSGHHLTFYDSADQVAPWFRTQRYASKARISPEHLLASSAIPFVFPAVALALHGGREFFGDGSIRQTAPISPAIHLGAQRVLVIGVGQIEKASQRHLPTRGEEPYPSLAQIGGHAMSSIFLDALSNDIERLNRINHTLRMIPREARNGSSLRPVDVLVISPSQRLDVLAAPHVHRLPRTVRAMLKMIGATDRRGLGLLSYLLFEAGYTGELVALGRHDALQRRQEVLDFFGPARSVASPSATGDALAGKPPAVPPGQPPLQRSARPAQAAQAH